jgi:hypothetical protein
MANWIDDYAAEWDNQAPEVNQHAMSNEEIEYRRTIPTHIQNLRGNHMQHLLGTIDFSDPSPIPVQRVRVLIRRSRFDRIRASVRTEDRHGSSVYESFVRGLPEGPNAPDQRHNERLYIQDIPITDVPPEWLYDPNTYSRGHRNASGHTMPPNPRHIQLLMHSRDWADVEADVIADIERQSANNTRTPRTMDIMEQPLTPGREVDPHYEAEELPAFIPVEAPAALWFDANGEDGEDPGPPYLWGFPPHTTELPDRPIVDNVPRDRVQLSRAELQVEMGRINTGISDYDEMEGVEYSGIDVG